MVQVLREKGYDVTPVDVQDLSFHPALRPVLYDGHRLPFPDQSFDVVLVLTVLHHTPHPRRIVAEARRVGRAVVVIEDVYRHSIQNYLTRWTDSLVNLEFRGHPHQNHREAYWRQLFREEGLQLTHERSWRLAGLFRQTLFVLKAAPSASSAAGASRTGGKRA